MTERTDETRERTNDEVVAEIEARFKAMARAYALRTPRLLAWVQQGNKLPGVYV